MSRIEKSHRKEIKSLLLSKTEKKRKCFVLGEPDRNSCLYTRIKKESRHTITHRNPRTIFPTKFNAVPFS